MRSWIDATEMRLPRMPRVHPEAVRGVVARAARLSALSGRNLGRILWRRRLLVLACLVVVLGLTTAHVARVAPMFEAATLVTASGRTGLEPGLGEPEDTRSEGPNVADQLRLIGSRTMAEGLIDRLDLQLSVEFNPQLRPDGSWAADSRGAMGLVPAALLDVIAPPEAELTDEERAARLRARVVDAVVPRIRVEPAGSSALSLRFVSADPDLAAAGATALAELYLDHRLEGQQQARQLERQRLAREIERLAATVSAAERAIAELRATSLAGSAQASEQDLLGLTGELAFWRSERAELEASLRQAGGPLESDASLDQAARSLDPALLGGLSAREVELERRLAELSQAYGEQDPQVSSLKAELIALDEQKRLEVEQSVGQLEQEVAIIRARETALEAKIATLEGQLAEGQAVGGLETLERQAEADRELLRTYMDRATQLAAAPQAGEADARILAPAVAPKKPKYPRLALIYAIALGGALLLGSVVALGVEFWDRAKARSVG
jgi:succinoglycan biosynthesis transport protein ExoP